MSDPMAQVHNKTKLEHKKQSWKIKYDDFGLNGKARSSRENVSAKKCHTSIIVVARTIYRAFLSIVD